MLIVLEMAPSTDYVKAYETAKKELSDLIVRHKEIEKRIVVVRQFLQTMASMCESGGMQVDPSPEASYLLKHSTLADEIRAILKSLWPSYLRPHTIKSDLERLGHDLTKYQNSQATIHMVLKRMTESGEVQEGRAPENGRKAYRITGPMIWHKCDSENIKLNQYKRQVAK
jgi:hypothetical protein